jgi:hypothetical protein
MLRAPRPRAAPAAIRQDDLLQELVESITMADLNYRVTFERDEGQQYDIGARVTVHAMNGSLRTLALNPSNGRYQVMRSERVRDVGWRALRVSLLLVEQSLSDAGLASIVTDAG